MAPAPKHLHYIAISIFSFSAIVVQILFSRICSVVIYYHFAFAGITFTMLGLTAGALKVYTNPGRFTTEKVNAECAIHAITFAVALVIGTLLLVDIPGRILTLAEIYLNLWSISTTGACIMLGIAVMGIMLGVYGFIQAFIACGVSVTLLLTYFPAYTSRLYAVDLASAALGCMLVIVGLKFLDPVSILFLLAAMLSWLAWNLGKSTRTRNIMFAFCLLFGTQSLSYVVDAPIFKVRMGKFQLLNNLLFERWNTYSHVAIYPKLEQEPFGWGLSPALDRDKYPDNVQYFLKIDADAGTVLTKFNGDFNKIGYLKYDVINSAYHLRDIKHTAIIGVGGGRDVLSALVFGTDKITGIEINPAIFEALNKSFANFTGNLSAYPNVKLYNAEARSFINSHHESYDLVQISLIDTWATTAAGGLTLSENKLYTVDAWKEFLNHLDKDGILEVSRWYVTDEYNGEFYRMLSLAAAALKETEPGVDVRQHIIALNANNIVTLMVSKSPFTEGDMLKLKKICQKYQFTPLLTPNKPYDDIADKIASGSADQRFYDSLPLDVSPSVDDKPFFFNMYRMRNIMDNRSAGIFNIKNNNAIYVLFALVIITLGAFGYSVLWPLAKLYRLQREQIAGSGGLIVYFICIGLGFMFIEISQMQRLTIFLGHPVYGLAVILFTMLLFSGIGSYLVKSDTLRKSTYKIRSLLLCVLLLATDFATAPMMDMLRSYETTIRILSSVALLIPISLFMGMMFPLGVAAAEKKHAKLLPWFWALNGVASVFASAIAVVISMSYGISATYEMGVAFYVICFLISLQLGKKLSDI